MSAITVTLTPQARTIDTMGIPRVKIQGKIVRYRLSTVSKWLAENEET